MKWDFFIINIHGGVIKGFTNCRILFPKICFFVELIFIPVMIFIVSTYKRQRFLSK